MKTLSAPGISRRDFLKIGGAAVAVGLAGCGRRSSVGQTGMLDIPTLASTVPAYSTSAAKSPSTGPADIILKNGKVYTVDSSYSMAQAVSIKDGLIQAVGNVQQIEATAGPSTQVIDLGGRVVTPGFIDPHIHMRAQGLMGTYYAAFLPPNAKDIPGLQKTLAELVKTKKPGEWIPAYYLVLTDKMIPTKEDLDPVSPDNPVFIMHVGGHWATANSAALKAANVTGKTKSPPGGVIEMKNGVPTGVLYNHRAMDVVRVYGPPIDREVVTQGILKTQNDLAACGITSFQDNNVRDLEDIQAYQELTKNGQLFLRNDLYLTLEWPADLSKLDQVDHYRDEVTRFAGFKFLIDGQGPTAYCHERTNGAEWKMPTWEPDIFKQTVRTLHDTGLQICVHSIGDAAADLVLDAYQEAMNANPRSDPRHRIEHVILTKPEATQRIKDLGVIASVTPGFVYLCGDSWEPLYGPERLDRIMVVREWLDAGVHVTIGSDAPSMPFYNPQFNIASAMTRMTYKEKVIGADQVLTFDEALKAHTYEAAYAAHEENVKGSLEPGKFADIVVWTEDPSTLDPVSLAKTKTVYMTMVGGKTVYQS
jgi:predicted amidohydrolase YtcJ